MRPLQVCGIGETDATSPSPRSRAHHHQGTAAGGAFDLVLSCPHCPKTFCGNGRQQLYNRHVIVHTGEKPFSCAHCPYTANQRSNVLRHMKNRHGHRTQHQQMQQQQQQQPPYPQLLDALGNGNLHGLAFIGTEKQE